MEFFLLYLFVMLDQIALALGNLGAILLRGSVSIFILTTVFVGFKAFVTSVDGKDSDKEKDAIFRAKVIKAFKWPLILGIFFGIFFGFIADILPSPKQAAVIIGGGTIYNVVTSEEGKRVAGKIGSKLEAELDKLLGDEVPKKAPEVVEGVGL